MIAEHGTSTIIDFGFVKSQWLKLPSNIYAIAYSQIAKLLKITMGEVALLCNKYLYKQPYTGVKIIKLDDFKVVLERIAKQGNYNAKTLILVLAIEGIETRFEKAISGQDSGSNLIKAVTNYIHRHQVSESEIKAIFNQVTNKLVISCEDLMVKLIAEDDMSPLQAIEHVEKVLHLEYLYQLK